MSSKIAWQKILNQPKSIENMLVETCGKAANNRRLCRWTDPELKINGSTKKRLGVVMGWKWFIKEFDQMSRKIGRNNKHTAPWSTRDYQSTKKKGVWKQIDTSTKEIRKQAYTVHVGYFCGHGRQN